MIEMATGKKIDVISLSYNRMMNHIKYMVARVSTGETLKLDMNDYIEEKYPESYRIAEDVCESLGKSLGKKLDPIEIGYLAMHIERTWSSKCKKCKLLITGQSRSWSYSNGEGG